MSEEKLPETRKEELFIILDEMINSYTQLPREAMMQPITHWEHEAMLILMRALLTAMC